MKNESGIRFFCLADCSNCCGISGGYVFLTKAEAQKIAGYLSLDIDEFMNFFIRHIDDKPALVDGENEACVFLEDGQCMIYSFRPRQCRTFPFWKENMETVDRWQLTKQICPGIGKGCLFSKQEIGDILNGKTLDSIR